MKTFSSAETMQGTVISKVAIIDQGYSDTKALEQNSAVPILIPSRYEKTTDIISRKNTYILTYNDTDYLVGEGATMNPLELDKTQDELYRVLTYTVLSQMSNSLGTEFNLVCSYPLNQYFENQEKFASYIRGEGEVETYLNGAKKLFIINDVTVFPQCASIAFANENVFKDRTIGIIDIGGLTINGCIFDNMNLYHDGYFTENLGIIILLNNLKKELDKKYGIDIQPYQLKRILSEGLKINGKKAEGSDDIIKNTITEYLLNIKYLLRRNKWAYETLDLFFSGGGSLLLNSFIKDAFKTSEISKDCVFDNVKGLSVIGRMMYNA